MYLTIPIFMTVDQRGWSMRVAGKPPYIVTAIMSADSSGFYPFEYISSDSPTPNGMFRADQEFNAMYNKFKSMDLMFTYYGDVVDSKSYDLIMKFYDRRLKDNVESLLSQLVWDNVKVEQQTQFLQGVRVSKVAPLLGLQMCLDAYNFDDFWANVDWSNPLTYFNAVKNVIGLVGSSQGVVARL